MTFLEAIGIDPREGGLEIERLKKEIEELKMICRRLSATKTLKTKDKIAKQCCHLFKGSPLR